MPFHHNENLRSGLLWFDLSNFVLGNGFPSIRDPIPKKTQNTSF